MVQSKQELRDLLDRARIELRPNLGQNFLIDQNLMHLLVNRANLQPDDTVHKRENWKHKYFNVLRYEKGAVLRTKVDGKVVEKKVGGQFISRAAWSPKNKEQDFDKALADEYQENREIDF